LADEGKTGGVPQTAGFLYVLVNSAMPGLVKVGKTQRDPDARAQELSGVTGIPTPFVVAYNEWFSDCAAAEDFVHAFLETKGYRVAENREFFSAPVKVAIQAIMQAKAQQPQNNGEASGMPGASTTNVAGNDGLSPDPWSDLLKQADAALSGLGDAVEDHLEAVRLYEHAARMGSGQACLILGILSRLEEFGSDDRAAIKWFNEGVHNGAVEGYAELSLVYLEKNQGENAAKCFAKYTGLRHGQPLTDSFWDYVISFLITAVKNGIVIENLDETERYRDQIIQYQEAKIARMEASMDPSIGRSKPELLRLRYLLHGNVPDQRHNGTIKWWNPEKNLGFIAWPGGEDMFLLGYQIVDGKLPPRVGQRVSFVPVKCGNDLLACVVFLERWLKD
jgi:cold shock CspA family protein